MSELDALFEDDAVEEVTEEITAEDESEEVEADETDEEGSTAEPETIEEIATDPEEDKLDWAKVAYMDEKRKRQELERRLETLESGKAVEHQAQDPDLFADPDTVLRNLETRAESKAFVKVVNFSRDMMREAKPDYEQQEAVFVELAKADPSLVDKMKQSDNPARFAYETAKKHAFMQEVSDPVKYREKIKAELLAELAKSQPKKKPSLANTTSVGGGTSSPEDLSLGSILGR